MTLEELKPFGDRIVVRPDAKIDTSEGGLYIPQVVLADNPNYYTMTGVVVRLGDGYREDVYQCQNQQCGYESRRTVGEYCPVCKATQKLAYADSGVHAFDVKVGDRVLFGRFAGKQVEVEETWDVFPGRPPTDDERARHQGPGEIVLSVNAFSHSEKKRVKVLIMREVEVLGILDGDEQVKPGYQGAEWNKPSKGLTPEVNTIVR